MPNGVQIPTVEFPFAMVADFGGTFTRFALVPLDGSTKLTDQHTFRAREFRSPLDAVDAFLTRIASDRRPRIGIAAVAGPAIGDMVKMTNGEWVISVATMAARQGFEQAYIINDTAAISWAMLDLDPEEFVQIGNAALTTRVGKFIALGSGTGLGVSAVTRDGDGRLTVVDTEGGHVDFAPVSAEEDALLAALRARFGRVSCERLLSGQGLVNIFEAITARHEGLEPEEITSRARAGDPDARRAIEHFCGILGSFAGNVALMHGARDGVFLAGGMLRAMSDTLSGGIFRERFEAKGRFSRLLMDIPTVLLLDPSVGLRGAASALHARLRELTLAA